MVQRAKRTYRAPLWKSEMKLGDGILSFLVKEEKQSECRCPTLSDGEQQQQLVRASSTSRKEKEGSLPLFPCRRPSKLPIPVGVDLKKPWRRANNSERPIYDSVSDSNTWVFGIQDDVLVPSTPNLTFVSTYQEDDIECSLAVLESFGIISKALLSRDTSDFTFEDDHTSDILSKTKLADDSNDSKIRQEDSIRSVVDDAEIAIANIEKKSSRAINSLYTEQLDHKQQVHNSNTELSAAILPVLGIGLSSSFIDMSLTFEDDHNSDMPSKTKLADDSDNSKIRQEDSIHSDIDDAEITIVNKEKKSSQVTNCLYTEELHHQQQLNNNSSGMSTAILHVMGIGLSSSFMGMSECSYIAPDFESLYHGNESNHHPDQMQADKIVVVKKKKNIMNSMRSFKKRSKHDIKSFKKKSKLAATLGQLKCPM